MYVSNPKTSNIKGIPPFIHFWVMHNDEFPETNRTNDSSRKYIQLYRLLLITEIYINRFQYIALPLVLTVVSTALTTSASTHSCSPELSTHTAPFDPKVSRAAPQPLCWTNFWPADTASSTDVTETFVNTSVWCQNNSYIYII